jgi:hypothetical protein
MRTLSFAVLLFMAFMGLGSQPLPAYVKSAILEYSCDDQAAFWLNGKQVMARSDYNFADYAVLSTSDGTLPLDVFNMNGDNLLAVENFDTEAGHMGISYRLTVHHSSGDPVVIWSEPGNTRFLHLKATEKDPEGWAKPDFDDGGWGQATEGSIGDFSDWFKWYCLTDPAFGFLGVGCVPFLAHMPSARASARDHNLMRSHFKFPNTPAKVQILSSAPSAARGQKVSFRLVPGPDAAYEKDFQLFARVPKGMKVESVSKGGYFDPKSAAIFWNFSSADPQFVTLNARTVISAGGWARPEKVLGPPKPGKVRRQLNTPQVIFDDGAKFVPSKPGWFAMDAPPAPPAGSKIVGVIFHSQIRLEGVDTVKVDETNPILFNYSTDGTLNGALKNDVVVSRGTTGAYWIDGYYDASADRNWTWPDLNNLRVKFEGRQRRLPRTNRMASVSAIVRFFEPGKISPYFFTVVDADQCAKASVAGGIRKAGAAAVGSEPVTVALNERLCAPTPVPTPTPIPTATPRVMVAPTPEPTKSRGVEMSSKFDIKLGCLNNSPQPFKRVGTYVYFCIKAPATIQFSVFDSGGKQIRSFDAGSFPPGENNQLFFNGLDDAGNALKPGDYLYTIRARDSKGGEEVRNATFTRGRDK